MRVTLSPCLVLACCIYITHSANPLLAANLSPDKLKLNTLIPNLGQIQTLPPSKLTDYKPISIHIPSFTELTDNTDFDTRASTLLKTSIPKALSDFGKDSSLADGAVPLVKDAVISIFSAENAGLQKRGFFGDLWDWVKDAGCGVFAAAATGAFLLAAGDFAYLNGKGEKLSEFDPNQHWKQDILYFMWPIHGDIGTSGPVTLYFQATRAVFFGGAKATTINRDVYTRLAQPRSFDWRAPNGTDALAFYDVVTLMLHEFEHVKQYRENGYSLVVYAHRYLFEWCFAGGYDKSVLEVSAKAHEHDMDADIEPYSPASDFFLVWSFYKLENSLGYPLEVAFSVPDPTTQQIREKRFQFGVLQLGQKTEDGARCYRTYTSAEIAKRVRCGVGPCWSDSQFKKRSIQARAPMGPHRVPCNAVEREEWKQQCEDQNKEWMTLKNRQWVCNNDVPGFN